MNRCYINKWFFLGILNRLVNSLRCIAFSKRLLLKVHWKAHWNNSFKSTNLTVSGFRSLLSNCFLPVCERFRVSIENFQFKIFCLINLMKIVLILFLLFPSKNVHFNKIEKGWSEEKKWYKSISNNKTNCFQSKFPL